MYTNQTNNMLAQDGMLQKGGTVDPVSGNDVPPGAMPEEVRDDIDAKLSEGEFVVPADVVRYIGLAKLMQMRDEAKRGLKKMADIGQMGNSKKGAEGEALHGEEEGEEEFASSIDEIMNEEAGGEEEEETKEYAAGGYVPRASGYDPAESVALYSRAPIKGFEMIPMSNDAGNTIYIPFINGKPQLQIPPGYVIKAKAGAEAATPVPEAAVGKTGGTEDSRGGGGGQDVGGVADTGGLPPAADRTDFRSAVLSIPDFMKAAPVIGTPISLAKSWAEKSAAADKAYLSPFEDPMAAARSTFTQMEREAPSLSEANAAMETARSAFTASERASVINSIIDSSITNKTDPSVELDALLSEVLGSQYGTTAAPTVQTTPTALAPSPALTTTPTAMVDPAQAQQAAAAKEAEAQASREAAAREAKAAAAREAAAKAARESTVTASVSGDGGYGGVGGTTGGGDTMGFGGEYAKGGMVTKPKNKGGFIASRSYPAKKKSAGFVPKK